ncbi:hypothetical protein HYV10_03330 [Candidatus Dependentiae bacterium]|nr:hypothetical protein [Candidatus Dependentiae bacterium]
MKKLVLFCFLALKTSFTISNEYLYPIINLDDETILMMHQKSLDDLELLSFNVKDNSTQKLLSSLYLPAYVKIIPGKNRYSFIDRGRIYIKDFSKRTPRVLDIYQSIYDIQSLQWVSNHECVFSAKYKNHYKIFMYDINKDGGTLYALCRLDDEVNYIFPSIIHRSIFCLAQKHLSERYNVAKIIWNPIIFEQSLEAQDQNSYIEIIPLEHNASFCFLNMIDQQLGYILEIIDHNHEEKIFKFGCCKIDLNKNSLIRLFEFEIPQDFIIGMDQRRFFESLYPLLPYYTDEIIYFTSYDTILKKLTLYLYNQNSKNISKYQAEMKSLEQRDTFSPLILQGKVYLGHNLLHEE